MNLVGISKPNGAKVLLKKDGNTDDIISAVLDCVGDVRAQTREFSRQFSPDKSGLRKLWGWVRNNIRYEEDPLGVQWVREPARLWHDRVGDCKSFTVFIVSVLENMGLDYYIRFSNTERKGSKTVNHVYPVAILPNGQEVIVDAVYNFFDSEAPWHYIKDYPMSEIYRLSGIGKAAIDATEQYLQEVQELGNSISDDVLENDLTEMSQGEFARWQQHDKLTAQANAATDSGQAARFAAAANAVKSGSISGIGGLTSGDATKIGKFLADTSKMNGKAFSAPLLALPDSVHGAIGKGIIKAIGDAIKNAWKKVINWIFKTALPMASPFFLYSFLKKNIGKKTEAKRQKQAGLISWIQKTGQFDSAGAVMEGIKSGIVKKMGNTPENLLNAAVKGGSVAGAKVGFVVAAAAAAVQVVIEIITKIAKLFKKSAPAADASGAPDLQELSGEYADALASGQDLRSTPSASAGKGDNTTLIVVGVAAVAALVLLKT